MKTKSLIIVAVLTSLSFLTSCEKDSFNPNNNIVLNESEDNFVLNKAELDILKRGVARLSANKNFRNAVYKSVSKKFDGDDNVLLNEVVNLYKNDFSKGYISSEFDSIVNKLNMNGLYPQIFIPYFEESILKGTKSNDIIYVIEALNVHDSVEFFSSIFIDENGAIANTEFLINESFASENEVWVLSLNERVDQYGKAYKGSCTQDSYTKSNRTGTKHEYLMKIKCPNLNKIEGWVKGAPELRLLMKSVKGEISEQYFYPDKRKQINNKWWTVDGTTGRYLYYWDVETYTKTVHFTWVEVDNFGDQLTINSSFTYKDVDKETGQEYTGTAGLSYTIKSWDMNCGSISLHIDDGMMGDTYNTGLIRFKDSYR